MHFTGEVYRHPMEANTQLLEVTAGCSYNKCSFCTMYRNTKFGISPLGHIEDDLREIKSQGIPIKRIFLVNGEAFVLSTDKLIEIGTLITRYFPEIETITCYASISNIKKKSLEDLKKLRSLKFNQFHIGLESAYDPALKQMNKGFSTKEAYENIEKLTKAGIEWDAHVLTGFAGKLFGTDHIKETVNLINKFPPYMVSIMPLSASKGSELEQFVINGEFQECSELEKLNEEKLLLNSLDLNDQTYIFGNHLYNLIPINGYLKDRVQMNSYIDKRINELDDNVLNKVLERPNI